MFDTAIITALIAASIPVIGSIIIELIRWRSSKLGEIIHLPHGVTIKRHSKAIWLITIMVAFIFGFIGYRAGVWIGKT